MFVTATAVHRQSVFPSSFKTVPARVQTRTSEPPITRAYVQFLANSSSLHRRSVLLSRKTLFKNLSLSRRVQRSFHIVVQENKNTERRLLDSSPTSTPIILQRAITEPSRKVESVAESSNSDSVQKIASAVAIVLVSGILLLSTAAATHQEEFQTLLSSSIDWIRSLGPLGYVVFVVCYVMLEIIALPAIPFTVSAGFLFGVLPGTIVISVGSTTAAAISFLIGRYVARDWVVGFANKYQKFRAIDAAIGRDGFKIVALLRLSPLLPFSISNYLYGLTAVRFWPYVIASWIGMLPGTIAYVYAGNVGKLLSAGNTETSSVVANPGLVALGLASTLLVGYTLTNTAKQALNEYNLDPEPSASAPEPEAPATTPAEAESEPEPESP